MRGLLQGVIAFSLGGALSFACSGKTKPKDAGPPPDACTLCITDMDCANGGVCSQLANDSYCAVPCGANGECPTNTTCISATTAAGDQASLCAPTMGDCATSIDDGGGP